MVHSHRSAGDFDRVRNNAGRHRRIARYHHRSHAEAIQLGNERRRILVRRIAQRHHPGNAQRITALAISTIKDPKLKSVCNSLLLISLKRGGRIFGEKLRKRHEHGMGPCHLSACCGGYSSRSPLRG